MVDVLTPEQRRLNMQRIRGRDTKPEMLIRRGLHARGFRYRLHDKSLPGRPDIIFRKQRAVIFVHGCFWHGHNCPQFKWPETRRDFWRLKIEGNRERDSRVLAKYLKANWRVLIVWECAFRGSKRRCLEDILDKTVSFLCKSEESVVEL